MVGRMVTILPYAPKKKKVWATSLCFAVKYVGAQKFLRYASPKAS